MDDRYDLILGVPWLMKHEPWIDVGAIHKPLVERALAGHVPSLTRDGFVHEHHIPLSERLFAGSAEAMGEQGCRGSTDTLEGVEAGAASTREVATVGGVQMEVLWSLHLKEQVSLDDICMKELCFLLHRKTQPWVVVQVGVLW